MAHVPIYFGRLHRRSEGDCRNDAGDCHVGFKFRMEKWFGAYVSRTTLLVVVKRSGRGLWFERSCEDPLCRNGDHVSPYR